MKPLATKHHGWRGPGALVAAGILGLVPGATAGSDAGPPGQPPDLMALGSGSPALSPAESAGAFRVEPGFRVELVAAEPLVASPIAIEFDEDGGMFVAEDRDYPLGEDLTVPPLGRVRLLRDRDGDGRFDAATIFADGLRWPSGMARWKGGLFVVAPPDLLYLKDTDDDGAADVRERVFSGFGTGASEDIANNLRWGLDHHVYGITSYNGGTVKRADSRGVPVKLDGYDFRFHPVARNPEAITGGTGDFGQAFDDWGNRFSCNSDAPVMHEVLPARYLARNPFLVVRRPMLAITDLGPEKRVFPVTLPEAWRVARKNSWSRFVNTTPDLRASRFPTRELALQGHVTGVAGVAIYRGEVFPEPFRGNAFSGEPAGNLVIRTELRSRGATFTAVRPNSERREFLASTDNRFRPVNVSIGPDGALYVVDMYRDVIEYPSAIPDEIRRRLDLVGGRDRGRIWRIVPEGFRPPRPPRLGAATPADLIAALEHPEGWWRDTAHRLLFERQDRNDKAAVAGLRLLLAESPRPQARLHALWSLEGLAGLTRTDLLRSLRDSHSALREHAVRLSEKRMRRDGGVRAAVLALASDASDRVRFQVALSLGQLPGAAATDGLATVLRAGAADPYLRAAVSSGSAGRESGVAGPTLVDDRLSPEVRVATATELGGVLGARRDLVGASVLLEKLSVAGRRARTETEVLGSFLTGVVSGLAVAGGQRPRWPAADGQLAALRADDRPTIRAVAGRLLGLVQTNTRMQGEALQEILRASQDTAASEPERVAAIAQFPLAAFPAVEGALGRLLASEQPRAVQLAGVAALERFQTGPALMLATQRLGGLDLAARERLLGWLTGRKDRALALLAATRSGTIPGDLLDEVARTRLREFPDPTVARSARAVLDDSQRPPEAQTLASYAGALARPGRGEAGKDIYLQRCAACHKAGESGHPVGPDVSSMKGQGRDKLLLDIVAPNRSIQPNYLRHVLETWDGEVHDGIVATRTPSSITLRRALGEETVVLAARLKSDRTTNASLMPEGLLFGLSPDQIADLLAFLTTP